MPSLHPSISTTRAPGAAHALPRRAALAALLLPAGAARAADCTATLSYLAGTLAPVAVPGVSSPLTLGLLAAAAAGVALRVLRPRGAGAPGGGRLHSAAWALTACLAVALVSTTLHSQPAATNVSLSQPGGGSAALTGVLPIIVTNDTTVPLRLGTLVPGPDTSVLTPPSTCAANQLLAPGASCTVGLGGACAATFTVRGTVRNDINGLADGAVNGSGTNAGGLFAHLVSGGNVVASAAVGADGSYALPGAASGSYSVVIATSQTAAGGAAPAPSRPAGWAFTGEGVGAGNAGDGAPDGRVAAVTVAGADVGDVDFGIEQPPTATGSSNKGPILSTDSDLLLNVPPSAFVASDPAPGAITSLHFPSFPALSTSNIEDPLVTINGTVYTPATWPAGGVTVVNLSSFVVEGYQNGTLEPTGNFTVTIPFEVRDAAGQSAAAQVVYTLFVRIN